MTMNVEGGAALLIHITTNKPIGAPVMPVYLYTNATLGNRRIDGGPITSVYSVSDAELANGTFKLEGRTADIPVIDYTSIDTSIPDARPIPVYILNPSTSTPPVIPWLYQETFETNPGTDLGEPPWGWYNNIAGSFDSAVPIGVTNWGNECCKIVDKQEAYLGPFPQAMKKLYLKFDIYIHSLNIIDGSATIDFEPLQKFHLTFYDPSIGIYLFDENYVELLSGVPYNYDQKYTVELWWDNDTTVTWRLDINNITVGSGTYLFSALIAPYDSLYIFSSGTGDEFYIDNIFILDDWP